MDQNLAIPSSASSDGVDSRSNQEQSEDTSQHLIQPQNAHGWLTTLTFSLIQWIVLPALQALVAAIIMALGDRQPIVDGLDEQSASVDIGSDVTRAPRTPHHSSFKPVRMQAEGRNILPDNSELAGATAPSTTLIQGAQSVNISGHPRFTNIGMNAGKLTTVYNYGGTHGLENLKDFVSFAALHDSAEQDPTRRCHPGTRKSVLSQLRDWFEDPNATEPICWLHGPAGAGKSAIAQTIAQEYKKRGVVATFFFYRSDAERNDGNRLFPTIAWQLAFSIPIIKDFIVRALDDTPHLPRQDVETQFDQLVAYSFEPTNDITFQTQQPAPVVIIDGVDECFDEQLQRRILTVIGNAIKDCLIPLHFLICSRPEALIEDVLNQFKDFTLRIDLATLDDSNRDIDKYLVDQFSDIASKRGLNPTWPGPKIIEEFVFKSSGNFIFAATVMRYISDEDCDPEDQLDIVRNLKPRGKVSPFALLDELYLEILKQQRDQEFLKTFLALLVGRTSIDEDELYDDDATLMNVSEKKLHTKLRRMRSLLKFKPFIDVYHKSFLDFLQDPSRSGQYHISKQGGHKRYLELIVNCVVEHVTKAIEQSNDHEKCCSNPAFTPIIYKYPAMIRLNVDDWQAALKPLLCLRGRLLNRLKPKPCGFTQVMRSLLLHLVILERTSYHMVVAQVSDSNINETLTERLVSEAGEKIPENDLDKCLSVLLSYLQKVNPMLAVDTVILEHMSSLLTFDHAETAARFQSVTDAQTLIDCIDLLISDECFLSQCGQDAARKAALLASEIFARVPLLPRSILLNAPTQQYDCDWHLESEQSGVLEFMCQRAFISRILEHNYIVPSWWMCQEDEVKLVYGNVPNRSVDQWLQTSSPNFVTRTRVMLEVARAIEYVHFMDVAVLGSFEIRSPCFALDSNLRVKIIFRGFFAWQVRDNFIFDPENYVADFSSESNISAFANLFHSVCFDDHKENLPNHLAEDAKQLIQQCRAEDPYSRPTMESIVKEMETWNLT